MNKFFPAIGGLLAFAAPLAIAQVSTWIPDKAHSEIDFTVLHLGLSNVHGRFGNIGGSIALNENDITRSMVNVTIDVTSVDTGVAPRDTDLKSASFFDVAQFPTATFVSTSVAKTSNGLAVAGNLTLHGVTKPVNLQVEGSTGPVQGMDHKPHSGFSATTTLKRSDFDVGAKIPNAIVGDDIKLTIDLDLAKQ